MTRVTWSSLPEEQVQTQFLSERTIRLTREAEDRLCRSTGRVLKRRLLREPSSIILQAVASSDAD